MSISSSAAISIDYSRSGRSPQLAPLVHGSERRSSMPTLSLAAVFALITVGWAYGAPQQTAPSAPETIASGSAIILIGCVARAADGKGFVLTQQAGAPGTATSPQT